MFLHLVKVGLDLATTHFTFYMPTGNIAKEKLKTRKNMMGKSSIHTFCKVDTVLQILAPAPQYQHKRKIVQPAEINTQKLINI